MTATQFAALRAVGVPKLVVIGVGDPEMPRSDAALTAQRIGAPPPVYVPGRHLTMIASPHQVAAAIDSLGNREQVQAGSIEHWSRFQPTGVMIICGRM